ncbi:MAG: ABC transporter permease subunit [Planctomycetaceae bacterium]|nr:ABC transporter permease subunit [Planctomycetaceae bacterium]
MNSKRTHLEHIPWWRHLSFPLLTKELTEQANRRRTYVVRFLYAAVLFLLGIFAIAGDTSGNVRLGAGGAIFHNLVQMQFWLILIFLPATASGALTIEKERDTLSLLLITTIPPWSIVVQKYLSRLLPMLSFLLLGFPLLAVAYSYGGVSTNELLAAIAMLILFAVQVAAVSIFASTWCRTTGEAFIATYLILAVMSIFGVWPMTHFRTLSTATGLRHIAAAQIGVVLSIGASVVCLFLACMVLERRAFLPARNVLLQMFRRLDKFYEDINQVTGGIVLVNDGGELPDEQPIAWRETSKKSLGTVRYLFRVLTVLEVPILFVAATINLSNVRNTNSVSVLLFLLWTVGAAMLCVHASGVIASERSHQTLDPLLTTPLTGADILKQKLAGVRRLIFVLLVPFASIFGFQTWFGGFNLGYLVGSAASALIFLWLIAWGALWIGLRLSSPMKAVLTSMIVVALVCGVPLILETVLSRSAMLRELWIPRIAGSFSPASVIRTIEYRGQLLGVEDNLAFAIQLAILPFYGLALYLIRRECLRSADELLQRLPEDPDAAIDPFQVSGTNESGSPPESVTLAPAST